MRIIFGLALEGTAAVGRREAWSNPKPGNSGTILIVDTLSRDGMECRSPDGDNTD
jgi:hypothetical protein